MAGQFVKYGTAASSVTITTLPGGLTGYADGVAWAAGNIGLEVLAIRKDTVGAFSGVADGDYSPLQISSLGYLRVTTPFNAINGTAIPTASSLIGGSDGTNIRPLLCDSSGHLDIVATNLDIRDLSSVSDSVSAVQSGTWNITNISGTVSLPTGAATEATLSTLNGKVPANLTVTATRLLVDGSGVTQPISAASLPLPADASTETTLSALNTKVPANLTVTATRLLVDPSGVTSPVSIASAVPTRSPINTNGQCDNTSLTATTATTATAPANAIGFIFEAPSDNTDAIRWRIGGTASTTAGMLAEPGRDSGFVPCSANVSVCATVSGTNAFSIQWIMSS